MNSYNTLCQIKAVISLINDKAFHQLDETTLHNSLYAVESMLDLALDSRDKICQIINQQTR